MIGFSENFLSYLYRPWKIETFSFAEQKFRPKFLRPSKSRSVFFKVQNKQMRERCVRAAAKVDRQSQSVRHDLGSSRSLFGLKSFWKSFLPGFSKQWKTSDFYKNENSCHFFSSVSICSFGQNPSLRWWVLLLIFCNYALSYWPSLLVWQYSIINPVKGWKDQFFSVPRSKYPPPPPTSI